MAYLLFNADGVLQSCVKEKADFNLITGVLSHYENNGLLKQVSRDNYISVVCREKDATLQDGNVVLSDPEAYSLSNTQEDFQRDKDLSIGYVNNFLQKHSVKLGTSEFSSLNTRLNDFKTALTNLDLSSLSYPITTRFLRYWFDNQSVEPFTNRYLQN
jgi:hypothetical protein